MAAQPPTKGSGSTQLPKTPVQNVQPPRPIGPQQKSK